MVTLSSDFECGNGKNVQQLGEDHFRIEEDGDKQGGYCAYFCFDVINDGPAREVTVEIWEDPKFGGPTAFYTVLPTTVWVKPVGFHRYRPLHERQPQAGPSMR